MKYRKQGIFLLFKSKIMAKNENNTTENSKETKVIVKFPDKLELSMVQANELRHYELFQWLVAFLAPIASGFWT